MVITILKLLLTIDWNCINYHYSNGELMQRNREILMSFYFNAPLFQPTIIAHGPC